MGISYNKLWHLLLDKGMNKSRLPERGIHSATLNKLRKNETVTSETIAELCAILECQPGDIMEYVPNTSLDIADAVPKGE